MRIVNVVAWYQQVVWAFARLSGGNGSSGTSGGGGAPLVLDWTVWNLYGDALERSLAAPGQSGPGRPA
jgi:hypothetical protein